MIKYGTENMHELKITKTTKQLIVVILKSCRIICIIILHELLFRGKLMLYSKGFYCMAYISI